MQGTVGKAREVSTVVKAAFLCGMYNGYKDRDDEPSRVFLEQLRPHAYTAAKIAFGEGVFSVAEIWDMENFYNQVVSNCEGGCVMDCRVLTCVYCGHEYPLGTPASGSEVLTDHIRECEKHPMKKLSDDNALLRKALVGLVGADKRDELEQIEAVIRTLPVPDVDKMNTINAIQALLKTSS